MNTKVWLAIVLDVHTSHIGIYYVCMLHLGVREQLDGTCTGKASPYVLAMLN